MTKEIDFKPRSWSFSAIHQYETCPLQYVLDKTDPKPREESWALQNGLRLHALMENFLLGNIEGVPKDLNCFKKELNSLKERGALPEEKFCVDKHWQPVVSEDKWKNKSTWLRGMLDARLGNLVIDLKSGRKYDHYDDQADIYATMLFQHFDDWNEIDVEFWYSKTGDVVTYKFLRSEHEDRMSNWDKRARTLMNEKFWLPKYNFACRWCQHQDNCELFA
tara:strand:- start:3074 stop:3733 length:660 start_codon:yes stop_codon:yes gene_type:complete